MSLELVKRIDPKKLGDTDHAVLVALVETGILSGKAGVLEGVDYCNKTSFLEITTVISERTGIDWGNVRSAIKVLRNKPFFDNNGNLDTEIIEKYLETGKLPGTGVFGLIERLRKTAECMEKGTTLEAVQRAAYLGKPSPLDPQEPIDLTPIDDNDEPIFIVKDKAEAKQLFINMEIGIRWQQKKLSTWYAANCIHTCSAAESKNIVKGDYKKDDVFGGLSWKPVVLTFSYPGLSAKLSELGIAVTEMDSIPESLEEFRAKVILTAPHKAQAIPDLPESALDGWLGKVCRERMAAWPRAFAWPALLAVAGALVDKCPVRTNLYVGIIGNPGSGKTTAIQQAIWLLGVPPGILLEAKIGSGEGLSKRIGDVGDSARLWFPDELIHVMIKSSYRGATFPQTLQMSWQKNRNDAVVAEQREIPFSCRLTLIGGLVTDQFSDAFGDASVGGLYDRFIFAECPSGFVLDWKPDKGQPVREMPIASDFDQPAAFDQISLEYIDDDVWVEKSRWIKELGINERVVENTIRVAAICAAFDNRGTLRAADLGPHLEFARYQEKMRAAHKANPGRTDSGKLWHDTEAYIDIHSPNGEWIEERVMLKAIHAWDYGLGIAEQNLVLAERAGLIERKKQGRKKMLRKRI